MGWRKVTFNLSCQTAPGAFGVRPGKACHHVSNADPHALVSDRFRELYDKGMYLLARLEARRLGSSNRKHPLPMFLLGLSDLALGRPVQARSSWTKARALLAAAPSAGVEIMPLTEIFQRLDAIGDLRRVPPPGRLDDWARTPASVGTQITIPPTMRPVPLALRPMKMISPMTGRTFDELARRASTFSYPIFSLKDHTQGGAPPSLSSIGNTSRHSVQHTVHVERHPQHSAVAPRASSPAVAKPSPAPYVAMATAPIGMTAAQQAAAPAPWMQAPNPLPAPPPVVSYQPPVQPQAAPQPPKPAAWQAPPPPPPAPKPAAPPQPAAQAPAANDEWAEWERDVYATLQSGRTNEALAKVRTAIGRYPTSSRLQEHEARVLAHVGEHDAALAAWLETHAKAVRAGSQDRAAAAAREALEMARENGEALVRVGKNLSALGSRDLAMAAFRLAVDHVERGKPSLGMAEALGNIRGMAPASPEVAQEMEKLATILRALPSSRA